LTDGGAAGAAIDNRLKTLEIHDQVKSKIVIQKVSNRPAETVAEGENELVFVLVGEIATVKGVELPGRFPAQF
jgi:hypothetical protein